MKELLLIYLIIKLLIFSCAHTRELIHFFVIVLKKQDPLNGEKKHMERTKYLYFSWTFDIVAKYLF
jgi:hypothetical protein